MMDLPVAVAAPVALAEVLGGASIIAGGTVRGSAHGLRMPASALSPRRSRLPVVIARRRQAPWQSRARR